MSFYRKRVSPSIVISVLLVTSLSCNLPLSRINRDVTAPIPVSSEAVSELEENVEEAAATAVNNGTINLVITEAQLTSIAVFELQSMPESQMLQDLQIGLQDGQINVSGDVINGGLTFPFLVAIRVSADGNGNLLSEIISARVGPFPLPQNIINQLTSQMNQVVLQQINAGGNNIFIEEIVIANGYLTVKGHLK